MPIRTLPVELIHDIFCFLGPCKVVQLRQVSKQFRDVSHERTLWMKIYASARFLRPPGPFTWQTTQYLERTLVRSEKLSDTWVSQPINVISRTEVEWKTNVVQEPVQSTLGCGRWHIWLEGKTVWCRDTDIDTDQMLYDGTDHPSFTFSAILNASVDNLRMYLLLVEYTSQDGPFKHLVEFDFDGSGFSNPTIFNLSHIEPQPDDLWQLSYLPHQHHGTSPFVWVQQADPTPLIFDVRSRTFHIMPMFDGELAESQHLPASEANNAMLTDIILTKTHIIAVRVYDLHPLVIQAFVIPGSPLSCHGDDGRIRLGQLCLTHQAITSMPANMGMDSFTLLRNSTVDPLTQSINIRLLHSSPCGRMRWKYSCVDLILSGFPPPTKFFPMRIHQKQLFSDAWAIECYTVSDDGYMRGLMRSSISYFIRKFAIDASEETCTFAVSEGTPLPDIPVTITKGLVTFDGVRGRIRSIEPGWPSRVVTVDIS